MARAAGPEHFSSLVSLCYRNFQGDVICRDSDPGGGMCISKGAAGESETSSRRSSEAEQESVAGRCSGRAHEKGSCSLHPISS